MTTFSAVSLTRRIGANTLIDIEGEFLVITVDEKKNKRNRYSRLQYK